MVDFKLEPGSYIVAVSGGVDSMALLHMLHSTNKGPKHWRLTVAHFDHGMRPDSIVDRQLVQATARHYGFPFVYDRTVLGEGASEDIARRARYEFLHKVRASSGAGSIITAHHQDDMLETAILNLIRGTGRRGLTSLKSTDIIKRPLLHLTKQDLINYARANKLKWREDSTNVDPRYLRNHLRHNLLPKFPDDDKQKLLKIIRSMHKLNAEIDNELKTIHKYVRGSTSHKPKQYPNSLNQGGKFVQGSTSHMNRGRFIMLPHAVAREVMLDWLRGQNVQDITGPMLERLVIAAKTLPVGKQSNVDKNLKMKIGKNELSLDNISLPSI